MGFSRDWRDSTFLFYYGHLRFNLISFSFPGRQDTLLEYARPSSLPPFKNPSFLPLLHLVYFDPAW